MERLLAAGGHEGRFGDAVAHGPRAVGGQFLHQKVVIAALNLENVVKTVHAVEKALAVGEVVAGAGERQVHREARGPRHAVDERLDGLHANDEFGLPGFGRYVGVPGHELDARFEFGHDSGNPGGLYQAVGVGEAQDIAVAGFDKLGEGVLFGAHPFGDFRDGEDVQARVALGIFREDFGGVVGAAVVGDPDVPLARVVLGEDGVEGGPDAGRFVTGGDQDAHVGLGFHVGFPEAHVPQGAVEPHLQVKEWGMQVLLFKETLVLW